MPGPAICQIGTIIQEERVSVSIEFLDGSTLAKELGISLSIANDVATSCMAPLGHVSLSRFGKYLDIQFLYKSDEDRKPDFTRLYRFADKYPELADVVKSAESCTEPGRNDLPGLGSMRRGLVESGFSDSLVQSMMDGWYRLASLEPYTHQEAVAKGRADFDVRTRAFLSGGPKNEDEVRQFLDYVTGEERSFADVELDQFHRSYPAFVLRYVNPRDELSLAPKILLVRELLSGSGYIVFAANYRNHTVKFSQHSEAAEFSDSLKHLGAPPLVAVFPSMKFDYDDLDSFLAGSFQRLLFEDGELSKQSDGKWTVEFSSYYYVQVPYYNLLIVREMSEALLPFFTGPSTRIRTCFERLSVLVEREGVSVIQCDSTSLTLYFNRELDCSVASDIVASALADAGLGSPYARVLPQRGTIVRVVNPNS